MTDGPNIYSPWRERAVVAGMWVGYAVLGAAALTVTFFGAQTMYEKSQHPDPAWAPPFPPATEQPYEPVVPVQPTP